MMTSAEKESHFRACYYILMKGYKDEHMHLRMRIHAQYDQKCVLIKKSLKLRLCKSVRSERDVNEHVHESKGILTSSRTGSTQDAQS